MSKEFIKDSLIRCAWTFAEALLSCMTVGQELMDINWRHSLSISIVAALIVLLKQFIVWARNHFNGSEKIDYSQEIQNSFNAESMGDMMEGNYDEAENYGTELE